jgi:hypothetical protein
MMRLLFSCFVALGICLQGQSQTATNFIVNDCSGVSCNLFANLDSGKVVVLTWVMPCAACISGAKAANSSVKSYSVSHAGKVLHFVADDSGNTTCATLSGWLTTNAITPNLKFSNAAINMADYGTAGMPKTVVLGGTMHAVYFNENNTLDVQALKDAIDTALAVNARSSEVISSIPGQVMNNAPALAVYPSVGNGFVSITSGENSVIEIYDSMGSLIQSSGEKIPAGERYDLRSTLKCGIYYARQRGSGNHVKKFVVNY